MIKVAIADDHFIVLNGVQKILASTNDITLTGSYKNGDLLIDALKLEQPDVLLLDIQMPGKNGIELAGIISKKYPAIKIIALTNVDVLVQVKKMLKQGCMGYLLKDVEPDILLKAIYTVNSGEQFIYEELKKQLINKMTFSASEKLITRREKEILQLITEEYTNPEIAAKLHISPHTVENHRNHLLQKLGVKNTAGLVKAAIEQGLV
ncbi:DNA-binding response regulator, NarL/FixJ family, contains REC and HTH domains [Filimonas lacunae]|uniref:DNA-binding response regulator, NarL/FixJ family, contains REC and HTH domains n=1 Tax=Filimonas lacunae TaxID=477680 RepID=A0A173MNU1_9BACT|nr:response regulator transcription factor [Filimonas lacunae]BAV09313.1 two-component transcriptional regulator, LuxR family [Filimonas lacunae]SIS70955.1 DNA-binding response regulator, NarL/FixJ family, contains REC and HTH domains [Filimonas lacunae]